jgi:hypothetical protein
LTNDDFNIVSLFGESFHETDQQSEKSFEEEQISAENFLELYFWNLFDSNSFLS